MGYTAPEFDDQNGEEKPGRRSDERSRMDEDTLVAANFLDELKPQPKDVATEAPSVKTNSKDTATGATIETDNNGLVRRVKRSDGSEVKAQYGDDANKKLESFVDTGVDKSQIVFKRQANSDTYQAYTAEGKPISNVPPIKRVELAANGNLTYYDQKDKQVVVRSNGAILPTGAAGFEVQFDTEGRIAKIQPSKEAIAAGAKTREFGYKGNTEELSQIKVQSPANPGMVFSHSFNEQSKQWECRDQNGKSYSSPPGKRALSRDGVYVYEDTIQANGKPLPVSRVCYPAGTQELQNSYIQPDGSQVTKTFNEQGQFIGVQTFEALRDKNGQIVKDKGGKPLPGIPGKKFTAGFFNNKPRILEADPVTGLGMVWDRQATDPVRGEQWLGQVISAPPGSPFKVGQKLESRFGLNFKEDGQLQYKDQKGAQHTEYRDRSQNIAFPDGRLIFTDQQGYPVRALKDKQNYLEYVWQNAKNGQKELAQVNATANGVKQEIWNPSGKAGLIQPDGRFSYEDKDGKLVFVGLDSTLTKYQAGKDGQGPTLTPVEVLLPNGAKRTIELGADPEHPRRIVDTFTDANGRNIERVFSALPVATPERTMAAHNQRLQEYQLTETVLSTGNFSKPDSKPEVTVQATVVDLEILKNGDIAATAPTSAKNPFQPLAGKRFEFKASSMAESILPQASAAPPNSIRTLSADMRLAQAKERFDGVFAKEILPRLPIGGNGKKMSAGEFMSQYLRLPEGPDSAAGQAMSPEAKNLAAYRLELAYSIVDQQKLDSEAKKKK